METSTADVCPMPSSVHHHRLCSLPPPSVLSLSLSRFQPPMEEGRRRRHSSSGDGRRRHPSLPSSQPQSQASSGPAPAAQDPAAQDAKPVSHKAAAIKADGAPDAKTLK